MYRKGAGVITDQCEAYIWRSIAKANRHEAAAANLRKNNWALSAPDIKSASREATQRLKAIEQGIESDKADSIEKPSLG